MGNDVNERVLALPRNYLFGPQEELLFNGFIGYQANIPNSITADHIDRLYANSFHLKYSQTIASESLPLFYPKQTVDNPDISLRPKDLVQIISYSVFCTGTGTDFSIFTSEFTPRSDTLKGRVLANQLTVGWGGHITPDLFDHVRKAGHVPNPYIILHDGHSRELGEEVIMQDMYREIKILGWLYLPHEKDEISPFHLAHVALLYMPSRNSLTVQPGELTKSTNPCWRTLDQISTHSKLAPWSRELLPELERQANKI